MELNVQSAILIIYIQGLRRRAEISLFDDVLVGATYLLRLIHLCISPILVIENGQL